MQNRKGQGATTNNAITLSQKIKLIKWCEQNKNDNSTYMELAQKATSELGFMITYSQMGNYWVEVNGRRNASGKSNTQTLTAKMQEIEARLDAIEIWCNIRNKQ